MQRVRIGIDIVMDGPFQTGHGDRIGMAVENQQGYVVIAVVLCQRFNCASGQTMVHRHHTGDMGQHGLSHKALNLVSHPAATVLIDEVYEIIHPYICQIFLGWLWPEPSGNSH